MIILKGQSIYKGYSIGLLKVINEKVEKYNRKFLGVDSEISIFEDAQKKAIEELHKLVYLEDESTLIMDAQAEMIDDPDFIDFVKQTISDEKVSAFDAIEKASIYFSTLFLEMDNEEMKERSNDIKDACNRIKRIINNSEEIKFDTSKFILVSEDLKPSEFLSIGKEKLKGIILKKGSTTGHLAILANSFAVPSMCNVNIDLDSCLDNKTVILDSVNEKIIIDPDEELIKEYESLINKKKAEEIEIDKYKFVKVFNKNNKEIKINCNVQTMDDVNLGLINNADGIGLVRTEFLYMDRNCPPSEEEQFNFYKDILIKMKDKDVTIRTFDIGDDKKVPYIEDNNLRGIKLALNNLDLLKTQLKALYKASIYGNLKIMFPLITTLEEIKQLKDICNSIQEELNIETNVKLGVMIETKEAVKLSEELAKEVDFFSIGTNDLIPYYFNLDRSKDNIFEFVNSNKKQVFELIENVIKNAHEENITVSVCGELASHEEFTKELINLGIDELSVNPSSILNIKRSFKK